MPPAIVKAQVVIKATLCLLVIVMYLILEAINYYYYYYYLRRGTARSDSCDIVDTVQSCSSSEKASEVA